MRFALDASWQRFGRVVVAGSPLTIFRTTAAGRRVVENIELGRPVERSRLTERMLDAGAIHPVPGPAPSATATSTSTFDLGSVTIVTPQLGGPVRRDGRITVDDGSVPALAGASLRLPANRGPAAARNAARPLVRTPLVAFVDADVSSPERPAPPVGLADHSDDSPDRWIEPLLWHFDDPRVALVAPRVGGEPGSSLDMGAEPARVRAGTRVAYVPTAAVVVRVAALDDVGWFDEALRFGEDVDLVWRLDEAGWRCRYDPRSTVWHEPRPGLIAQLHQQVDYGSSAAPLAIRHPHELAPVRTNGWTAAAWGLAASGSPTGGIVLAALSAAALPRKLPDLPRTAALELAGRGHLAAYGQFAAAVRRVWWPLIALAAIRSRRARWIAVLACAAAPARVVRDLAYGFGVWRGMIRHRTLGPIVPRLSPWPAKRR